MLEQKIEEPEVIDTKKRQGLKKGIIGAIGVGIGLVGLSQFTGANPLLNIRSKDGVQGSVVQGVNTRRITVSSTEPSNPAEGDIWIDTS